MKSEVSVDFIHFNNKGVIITTNKAVASSNLNVVERYIKELNNIDLNNVMSLQLPQSKLYLKILEIPYFLENTNLSITSNLIKKVIKNTYIFNIIVLVSVFYPYVIKISPKLDMAVIWIDIWDSQNDMKAKCVINSCFNIGWQITTIR